MLLIFLPRNWLKKISSISFGLILHLIINSHTAVAQDLIVHNDGDSLNCSINKISPEYIQYTLENSKPESYQVIHRSQVPHFEYAYFETIDTTVSKQITRKVFPDFRIAINIGMGYHFAPKTKDALNADHSMYKNVRNSTALGLSMHYLPTPTFGLGFKYYLFSNDREIEGYTLVHEDGTLETTNFQLRDQITFFGLSFLWKILENNSRNELITSVSVGFADCAFEHRAENIEMIAYNQNIALMAELGYDIYIDKNLGLGFSLNLLIGNAFNLKSPNIFQTDITLPQYYHLLSRLEFSVGLRFQ
ncbi:MAG: hypothetical protein ACFCUU_05750 [Cyclobacteriaceae bacterium]